MLSPTTSITKARRIVGAIDKRIDAVRDELLRNETVDELDCHSWQHAWDRHPVLRAIEVSLFIRRHDAVVLRDTLIGNEARAFERRENKRLAATSSRICASCGSTVFAAAA